MRRNQGRQSRPAEGKANDWRAESTAIRLAMRAPERGASELRLQEVLVLLHRTSILERGLRGRGGIRVTEERELQALRLTLERCADAVRTIADIAARRDQPVESLSPEDLSEPG